MTPQREEAARLLRLADAGHPPCVAEADLRLLTPYAVEYRYDDEAPELLSAEQARAIVSAVLAWSQAQIQASV